MWFRHHYQELAQMMREHGLEYTALPEEPLDEPFAVPTGAGIIFGVTGGVSEAVLRRAYEVLAAEPAHEVEFTEVRGFEGLRSCGVDHWGQGHPLGGCQRAGQCGRIAQEDPGGYSSL